MRAINTKFFLLLVIASSLLAGAVFGLHRLQASNIADALLWQVDQAEKDHKLDRAAMFLGRYLEFARDDLDQRERLGMILSDPQLISTPKRRARARFVIEQVLAKDPHRHALRQRLCQIALAERNWAGAKEHLSYLEINQPGSVEVPYLLGLWHEAQNQLPQAIDQYRKAVKIDAGKIEACTRLVDLLKQADVGKEPRHQAEIDRLVAGAFEKSPNDPGVLSLAAQQAQEKGDGKIALKYLEEGLKQHSDDPRLYLALARIRGQNGQRSEAIAVLQQGMQKVRKDQQSDMRWNLANLLVDENRADEAQKLISDIREVSVVTADYVDARLQMQRGRWFEAARQFERVRPSLKTAPGLALQIDLYLGACYEQLDEPLLQHTAFQRAVTQDPTSLVARRGMANALRALGQTADAARIHEELITLTQDAAEAARRRIDYARLLLQAGNARDGKQFQVVEQQLAEAEKILLKSIDIDLLRAELYFVRGEREKAEELLHETIKGQKDRHEPWLALLTFAAAKGDRDAVEQLMQAAEKRFNTKAAFRMAQVRFWMENRPADELSRFQRIEQDLPKFLPAEQSMLSQTLAEAYYAIRQYADAARVLQAMLKLPQHAQDVRPRLELLEVMLLQNDDRRACEVLDEIKRIEGDGNVGADWSFGEAQRLMHQARNGKKEVLEQARHHLTVAAAQRPNWHPIVLARAELEELQGRYDQAIANYRRALDLGSRDPNAMKQLIYLLSQANRFSEVDEVIALMQRFHGTTDDVVRSFIQSSYRRKDYQKADYLAKQLAAKNSKNFRDQVWLGQILTVGGKTSAEAEQAFRRAVELAPEQPMTWMSLLRYLASAGNAPAIEIEMDRIKKSSLPADLKDLTLAQGYELLNAVPEAVERYQAALKEQPTSVLAHRVAAEFFFRLGEYPVAESLYRRIVERKIPVNDLEIAWARRALAVVLARLDRPAKTVEALQLVGMKQDDLGNVADAMIAESVDDQLAQAKVLGSLNHHRLRRMSISILENVQQKNALQDEDQFFLARLLVEQDNDPAAQAKVRKLLRVLVDNHPRNPRILAFTARWFIQKKEFGDADKLIAAIELVEKDRKTAAGGYGSIELRARSLELRGLGAQAVILLHDYAEQSKTAPARKLLLAELHGRLGQFREAIDLCAEIQRTQSDSVEAIAVALSLLRNNRPSEAQSTKFQHWSEQRIRVETLLREALQRNPKDVPLKLQMADMLELQGNYPEVEKICREVLRDNDQSLVALNNLAWLLGQHTDKAAEALTLIDRAITTYGPRPELLDTRAVVLLKLGHASASIRDLERAVNEAPTPARLFHLSRAHDHAKNAGSALALLRRANEMGLSVQHLHPAEQSEYQRVMADLSKQ